MVLIIKNKIFWILGLVMVAIIIFLNYKIYFGKKEFFYKTGDICINSNCFETQVAENFFQQTKGLMFRKNLDQNKGMLFVFGKEANYPFWMKNTFIHLDIIWITENKKIIYIAENVQPCETVICPQIIPPENAKYVLEINGGLCQKLGIKVGDVANIVLQ